MYNILTKIITLLLLFRLVFLLKKPKTPTVLEIYKGHTINDIHRIFKKKFKLFKRASF